MPSRGKVVFKLGCKGGDRNGFVGLEGEWLSTGAGDVEHAREGGESLALESLPSAGSTCRLTCRLGESLLILQAWSSTLNGSYISMKAGEDTCSSANVVTKRNAVLVLATLMSSSLSVALRQAAKSASFGMQMFGLVRRRSTLCARSAVIVAPFRNGKSVCNEAATKLIASGTNRLDRDSY